MEEVSRYNYSSSLLFYVTFELSSLIGFSFISFVGGAGGFDSTPPNGVGGPGGT